MTAPLDQAEYERKRDEILHELVSTATNFGFDEAFGDNSQGKALNKEIINATKAIDSLVTQRVEALVAEAERRSYKQGWDSAGGECIKNESEIAETEAKAYTRGWHEGRASANTEVPATVYVSTNNKPDTGAAKVLAQLSINKKPRTQKDLLNFVTNPDNIKKAVESSMDKRQDVIDRSIDKEKK